MPCTCKRLTLRYACRHKEREFDRCWRYQFKKDFPCLGMVVSRCEAHVTHTQVPRVCRKCLDFFISTFGRKAAYRVSKKFLEFKVNNGLSREVIDPTTVPPEAYISSAELATPGSTTAYWSGQPSGQPFRPRSPMRTTSSWDLPSADIQLPEPVVHRKRHGDGRRSRSKTRSKSAKASKKKSIPRKPVPNRSKISKRDISNPILHRRMLDMSPIPTGGSDFESFPTIPDNKVVEHGTNEPIDLLDLVEDESDSSLDYELIYNGRVSNRFSRQRLSLGLKKASKEPRPQPSSSSLGKRTTKVAKSTKIMGYPNPEHEDLPSVPKLGKAPKVPAWRVESPSPEPSTTSEDSKCEGKKGRSKSAIPLSRTRELSPVPRLPAPATATATETYMVRGRISSELLTRPIATPLSGTLKIPPPPSTAGLKNFREKGIPSAAFLLEENIGEETQTGEESPAVLVSVSTPSPAYSCAVQSCYCSAEDDAQVCPSCLERRRLEPELQSKWL